MQAIGLIETKGLLAAVESADAMLKAAEVSLLDKTFTGGGLVTITVTGDVSAVKAAVDAGVAAVARISRELLAAEHVIPRPDVEIQSLFPSVDCQAVCRQAEEEKGEEEKEEHTATPHTFDSSSFRRSDADTLAEQSGIEKMLGVLGGFKVVKLRNLAREYDDFGITGRVVSAAGKDELIAEFRKYYENRTHEEQNMREKEVNA